MARGPRVPGPAVRNDYGASGPASDILIRMISPVRAAAFILVLGGAISTACGDRAARMAQEAGAIATVNTIHTAEVQYYSQYGHYGTLKELGPSSSGSPDANGADLIPRDVASGARNGYVFRVTPQAKGYQVVANPARAGAGRSFFSDETTVIRQSSTGEANAQSPAFGS